uniref:Uncharacterized protein n=1 Tax=Apteryx owenii TaxID=8824 RepID=A0A8B9S3Z9_APTOW
GPVAFPAGVKGEITPTAIQKITKERHLNLTPTRTCSLYYQHHPRRICLWVQEG